MARRVVAARPARNAQTGLAGSHGCQSERGEGADLNRPVRERRAGAGLQLEPQGADVHDGFGISTKGCP